MGSGAQSRAPRRGAQWCAFRHATAGTWRGQGNEDPHNSGSIVIGSGADGALQGQRGHDRDHLKGLPGQSISVNALRKLLTNPRAGSHVRTGALEVLLAAGAIGGAQGFKSSPLGDGALSVAELDNALQRARTGGYRRFELPLTLGKHLRRIADAAAKHAARCP